MDVIGSLEVRGIQGFTSSPIEFVDNNTICYTCGNHICFLNLKTKSKSLLQGPGRGIGAFTARGTSGIFAFSEQNVSPSIFVYAFPELHMKNELKGKAQLDYTSLALSDGGPYLGCCTSLPDHTITVWNWETAEPVCTQPQAGKDVISLVFNPMNWLQLCALGTASITVWNIEKSASLHVLKPCVVQLPASDGSLAERLGPTSCNIKGNKADTVVTKLTSGARLTPSAICWTTTSDLFVGCAEGFLFLVNPENLSVTVLFNPTTLDVAPDLADLRQSSFQGLTLNKNGVIAVMKDSVVHCLQIKGTQIDITQTWQIEGTATTAIYSPDYETLLLSSNTGQIYMLNSTRSDKIEKVLDILSGNFVAAAWSHSDKNICVSVRDSGELQLWTVDGMCRGSLPLQAEVTSVAYCPIAQYAAVGTKSGNVLFVDLNREQEPRLVHQVQLYHSSVDHLVFDQEGHHLLTGASDSNIYVIDAKPSKKFPIIGYTVVPGPILSLSTQCVRDGEQVKALALCARQEGNKHDSSLFTLPAKDLTGPDGVDQHGCPSPHVLKGSMNEVSHPLESCVLGVSKIFSYCHRKKTLQQFQLPQVSSGAETVDVLEQDESSNILLSAPPSHPTWLEGRQDAVMEEENQKYSEIKENLRKTIEELRNTIQEMRCENETLPAIERLAQQEFNLDVEDQRRQAAVVEQEVTRVRKEIEWEILVKCYFRDVLKRACWDSVKVKGRAIKSFHSEHEVKNYPLEERSEKEVEELRRVENIRKIEMAACTCDLKKCSNTSSSKEEEQGEEDHTTENAAVTGSFSAQLGYSNPYIYNQFSLKTTEQRINQFILLQDVIYRIKMAFNTEFEALHRQKVQELNHVRDRNRLLSEILLELDMKQQLWESSLTDSEWPESLLTVDDTEIKAEKYLTPEQRKEEEKKKLEEQRRLAAKEDDCRERALDDMMDGVLEVKKEDILKIEIPPPEFVLTKPDIHWTEEEKKVYKQYEKKTKELSERKEKYKKLLETEMKKLQASTRDATKRFDETLTKLFEKKIKCDMAVYQEKLKIAHLVCAVLLEEEMRNRELELKLELEKLLAHKDELEEKVKSCEEDVELFHKAYDTVAAEDKVLDKEFRKEFYDVPAQIVDHLYKLFRRRPRVQKLRTQTDNNPNPFKDQHLSSSQASDALDKMLKAMEELDAPENIPQGLNPSIWERFCLFRRSKIESEQKVKVKALALAEMQALLQKRRDETEAAEQEIKNLSDQRESLHKEKNSSLMDIMVQMVLKQSQVSTADVTAEDSDYELLHRSVVEELNKTIRMLGEQKIASMVECKDFRKGTVQLEWEHKVIAAHIEDLNNKARDIQTMRLSEEQRDYLTKTARAGCTSKQVSILEKTIDLQKETHQHKVQNRMKEIEQLNKQAAMKAQSNKIIEQQLPDMQVTVAERRHINEAAEENQEPTTEESYLEIPQKKHLKDYARAQGEDLVVLRAELERLRMRTFPSLDELKH
ncbi:cilia- and flagella-associated protein 43 isoform X2 [Paralichthys olivaceus]|uniref:cilia- and flagella-associated protein 43 isoform X2 n=1 Tax=Paralichthys olivaceus TaxID=8255 RepID=UPI003751ABF4